LKAGEILRENYGKSLKIDFKGEIDLVTDVDRRSEAFLIHEISSRFPNDSITAEESGERKPHGGSRWYIDPLDGTINYAHNIPFFAVSIGYARDGQMRLGTVYDPVHDEMFSAAAGRGAFCNGDPIIVSTQGDLDHSLLVTGFPYDIRTRPVNNLELFAQFSLRTMGVRRMGSAALDLCYVACGRFDGFWELALNAWDLAAGGLIASEAGALVTRVTGELDYLTPPYSILAANPEIHPQMLSIIRS
jgi:myo-inositol-1(or 4)-monophosphatase